MSPILSPRFTFTSSSPPRTGKEPLREEVRPDLHAYIGGILRDLDSPCIEINTEPDHAISSSSCSAHTISDGSGKQNEAPRHGSSEGRDTVVYSQFHWQNGFGAFSVSQSAVREVREYIRSQSEHHKRLSFQDEFRMFLQRYKIDYDEHYVWD